MTRTANACECSGKRLGRRTFLGLTAAVTASTLAPRYAFASTGAAYAGDTLVVLSQRGGADWLSLLPPLADPAYALARPTIAVPQSVAAQLDPMFGLHPAMAPLLPLFQGGQLVFVHAVGNPDPTRSHFDATRLQELAGMTSTGWLERAASSTGATGLLSTVHVGSATTPQAQNGGMATTAMGSLASFRLTAPLVEGPARSSKALSTLYSGSHNPAGDAARGVLDTVTTAATVAAMAPAAAYPATSTAHALADVARMVRANVGLQVATVDIGGWDLHQHLGAVGTGAMALRAGELATALAAFAADLGPLMGRVTLVTLTEFGRRVAENGSAGVDHGHGFGMLVMGGNVNGGRVYGTWPGLGAGLLDNGDLAATTDYRTVLGEILGTRMGVSAASVFPGMPSGALGILR